MIRINTQINAKTTIYHLKHYCNVCLKMCWRSILVTHMSAVVPTIVKDFMTFLLTEEE